MPERRDLPPLPLPPPCQQSEGVSCPGQAPVCGRQEGTASAALDAARRGDARGRAGRRCGAVPQSAAEAVFRLSHLAGEDNAGSEAEEDEVGGTIPPRLRAFNQAQKTWRGIKICCGRPQN